MSSPPDSVGLVSGLDSNDLLQDLMRWSGGVQSGHVSEQHSDVGRKRKSYCQDNFSGLSSCSLV